MKIHHLVLAPLLAALPLAGQMEHHMSMQPAAPDPNERLGTVAFSISCSASSQAPFNRGVALLHDFWYEEAEAQFGRLLAADPHCAIARWGLAISRFHQIWGRPSAEDRKFAWAQLRKAESHPAATPREREYIDALAAFFKPGPAKFPERVTAYSAAMGQLFSHYPDDVDAGAFYALSLLAAKKPDDATVTPNRKAMSVLTPLFARFPDHPGVVHYIIHACDNPTLAADGLVAADHYGDIAQSGAHAFHMPGHIYSRLGLWSKDIASQLGSIAASKAAEARGESGVMDEPHSYDFLLYACLQSGRDTCAKTALERSAEPLSAIASMPGKGAQRMSGMVQYYRVKLPVFYALEMRDWKSAASLEPPAGTNPDVATLVYWARAVANGRLRRPEQAQADLVQYDALITKVRNSDRAYVVEGPGPKIERAEILAWVAFAGNKPEEALTSMRTAADLQDQVGQAEVDIPAREMLADMLLEFNQPEKALAEYEVALKLSPNRLNGLFNAGRAAEAAGDRHKADLFYSALLKSTDNGTNSARPEFARARSFVTAAAQASK